MFRIAICDDESCFLLQEKALIISYMKRNGYDCRIDAFSSGRGLLALRDEVKQYDIIFLDINMEELDGLETAKEVRRYSETTYLVFVTAYLTYAIEGYKVNAIRFLIKDEGNLGPAMRECLDTIMKEKKRSEQKYCFDFVEGTLEVVWKNIIYVESSLHKLIFYMNDRKRSQFTMYDKLDTIETLLQGSEFCRIHKSYLVNLKYVRNLERYRLELHDGTILNIAKGKYMESNRRFLVYQGDL